MIKVQYVTCFVWEQNLVPHSEGSTKAAHKTYFTTDSMHRGDMKFLENFGQETSSAR
jgi:hypothetical protein